MVRLYSLERECSRSGQVRALDVVARCRGSSPGLDRNESFGIKRMVSFQIQILNHYIILPSFFLSEASIEQ